MINIGRHPLYLLVVIGLSAFALLLRLSTIVDGKVSHAAPSTLVDKRYGGETDEEHRNRLRRRFLVEQIAETPSVSIAWRPVPSGPINPTDGEYAIASTPLAVMKGTEVATTTPIPTNFLTPIVITPTIVSPTATPTATPIAIPTITPTFVPTTIAQYPIFVPLLVNQEGLLLRNGDFELGNRYWYEYSSLQYRVILDRNMLNNILPHRGEWAAWLGGKNNETSELAQRMTVPPETPVLRYWYRTIADADCGMDIASVLIDDELFEQLHLCKLADVDWTLRFIDLRQYNGQTITIKFRLDTDRNGRHSNLFLDDIDWVASSEP